MVNKKLNVSPNDLSVKPANIYNGDYIGNSSPSNLHGISFVKAGGALYIDNEYV